ncbi:MAG: DUF4402 domain-containing protein [Alphaproteobacteria bacterium]
MFMESLKPIALVFIALVFLGTPFFVFAAGVTVNQALFFGEWAVTSNVGFYNVNIDADGTYTNSAPFVLVGSSPVRGEYIITGLPASTAITSIDITELSEMTGPGSEGFSMDNFEVNYPSGMTTNGAGDILIYVGARANTSATAINYADGVHTGQLQITINY